jgi:prophage antirepressor-like protein
MSVVKQVYQTIAGEEELTIVVDEFNDFWFLGVVIAKILGYKDPRGTVNKKVDTSYKKSYTELMTKERSQNGHADSSHTIQATTTFLNEFGLYQLIMSSKLEAAKQFQHWVYGVIKGETTNEVSCLREQNLQLTNNLVEANKRNEAMFAELVKSNQRNEETTRGLLSLAERMATMAENLVSVPQDDKLQHALVVHQAGETEDGIVCIVLRTQRRRRLPFAEKRLQKQYKSKRIFEKNPCPNGFNALNVYKQKLRERKIPFKAKGNQIIVSTNEHTITSLFNIVTNRKTM